MILIEKNVNWVPILKGISIPTLFGLSCLMGILPIRWYFLEKYNFFIISRKNFQTNQKLIGVSNSFSGGIFISIAFIHFLPEVTLHNLNKIQSNII